MRSGRWFFFAISCFRARLPDCAAEEAQFAAKRRGIEGKENKGDLRTMNIEKVLVASFFSALPLFAIGNHVYGKPPASKVTLLNVSYDPTRELYVDFNKAFAAYWKGKSGQDVEIKNLTMARARRREP
jgi:hypothetical protein